MIGCIEGLFKVIYHPGAYMGDYSSLCLRKLWLYKSGEKITNIGIYTISLEDSKKGSV